MGDKRIDKDFPIEAQANGGPAFPVSFHVDGATYSCFGMSLRAYAAIHAPEPPAWWYSSRKTSHPEETGLERDAAWRAKWADAMVARLGTE